MSNTFKEKIKGKASRGLAERVMNSPKSQHDDVEEYGYIKHRKCRQNKKDFIKQVQEIKRGL